MYQLLTKLNRNHTHLHRGNFLFWLALVYRMTIPLPASEGKREAHLHSVRVFLQEIQENVCDLVSRDFSKWKIL